MARTFIAAPLLALALSTLGCSPEEPQSSGTNTNWLKACDSSDQCAPNSTCICGICSRECASHAECGPGVCGSALQSAYQCGAAQTASLCLPAPADAGACSSFAVPHDDDLASAPSATCVVPGALLCESFDAALPSEYSTWYSGAIDASIEDCLVHQGAGALRYQSSSFSYSQTRMRLASAVSAGVLSARFYVYVPAALTIPDYLAMFELWSDDATGDGKISVEAKPNDVLEVYVTPNRSAYASPIGTLRRDHWSCIALTLDVASAGGSVSLSVDGTPVIAETGLTTLPPRPISVAVVEGLPSMDATGIDLVIDDLVVASEPLACP